MVEGILILFFAGMILLTMLMPIYLADAALTFCNSGLWQEWIKEVTKVPQTSQKSTFETQVDRYQRISRVSHTKTKQMQQNIEYVEDNR